MAGGSSANMGPQRERKYGEMWVGSRQLFPQLRGRQPEGVGVLGFVKDPQGGTTGTAGACGVSPARRDLSNDRRPYLHLILVLSTQHNCSVRTNFLKSGLTPTFPSETPVMSTKPAACAEPAGAWGRCGVQEGEQ